MNLNKKISILSSTANCSAAFVTLLVTASLAGCSTVLPTNLVREIKSSPLDGLVVITSHVHYGFSYDVSFQLSFVNRDTRDEFHIRAYTDKKDGAPLLNSIPVEYDDGYGGIQLLRVRAGRYQVAALETKARVAPLILAPGIIIPMTFSENAKTQIDAPIEFTVEAGKINFVGEILLGPGSFIGPGACRFEDLHRIFDKHSELRSLRRVNAPMEGVECMNSQQRIAANESDRRQ